MRLETRTVDFVDVTSFVGRDVEFGEFAIESAVLVVATSNVSVERSKHLLTFVHLLLVVLNHDVTKHAKYTCTFETRYQYREEGGDNFKYCGNRGGDLQLAAVEWFARVKQALAPDTRHDPLPLKTGKNIKQTK